VLACCVSALEAMGLSPKQVQIRYSSRRLLRELMEQAGIKGDVVAPACLALDKRGKVSDDALGEMLVEAGLSKTQAKATLDIMRIGSLEDAREKLGTVRSEGLAELDELQEIARAYGIADWLAFDIGVVRGLAYYTGIVFECYDAKRKFRAIFGGGRYDNLLASYGGEDVTAVGCGFGDMVIMEVLEDGGLLPDFAKELDVMVLPFSEAERAAAVEVASKLRAKGERVDVALLDRKLGKALADAARAGAARVIIVAPDELKAGCVVERDMKTGEERKVKIAEV
jgi:histidyl-tRNA synthetase